MAFSFAVLMFTLSIQSYNYLMTRVCYARHNARIPFITQTIAIFSMIIFIFISYKITTNIYLENPNFIYVFFK